MSNEMLYQTTMHIIREMLDDGMITVDEYKGLRYVNICTWEKISEIMDISLSTVYRMHGSALVEAERFFEKL